MKTHWLDALTAGMACLLAAAALAGCATPGGGAPGARDRARAAGQGSWTELAPLTPLATAILYHQLAEGAPPDDALALAMPGVCDAQGVESRRAVLDVTWARLKELKVEVLERRSWMLALQLSLAGFDRQRGGFPTLLARDSGPRFGSPDFCGYPEIRFAVELVNWKSFSVIRMSEERALEFVRGNGQRSVTEDLEVEVDGVEQGSTPTLLLRVLRLRVRDDVTGAVLSDSATP